MNAAALATTGLVLWHRGNMSNESGTKAVFAALLANLGIGASKFVAFVFTGSSSMLSEAIHSVADSGNQILLLIGNKRASQAADEHHPFGYGRRRYVYGFVVSIVLFLVGGVFSLYEGLHKWQHPEPLEDWWIAVVVPAVAIGLEGLSFRTAIKEAHHSRGNRSLARFVRDARQPELPVILLEDAGALLGLGFALIGIGLAIVTGDGRFDAMGAMAVGTLLVLIAIYLNAEMTAMLVGAKIAIAHSGTGQEIAAAIDAAERALRAAVPEARYVFLEPDIDRTPPGP